MGGIAEFTVKRRDLLNELQLLSAVVDHSHIIPILSNVLMDAASHYLTLTATDQEISLRCGFHVEVSRAGLITVPLRRLLEIVRLLPDGDVQFSVQNHWVEIRCEGSFFRLSGISGDDYPEFPIFDGKQISVPSDTLREMVSRAIIAITQEESRYLLGGALAIFDPMSMTFVSTDGHRMVHIKKSLSIDGLDREIRSVIPRKALLELLKLIDQGQADTVEIGRDERRLYFSVGTRNLVSSILTGQFPNWDAVIPRENDKMLVGNASVIGDGVRRVSVMATQNNRPVKLTISTNTLELASETADVGQSKETLSVDYNGNGVDLSVNLNAKYISDFIGTVRTENISMEFKDSETQVMMRPHGEEGFEHRYILMPMSR